MLKILDDFLLDKEKDAVENFFTSSRCNWSFRSMTSGPDSTFFSSKTELESIQFVNHCYSYNGLQNGVIDPESFNFVYSVVKACQEELNFQIKNINRIKTNCTIKNIDFKDRHHPAHVDILNEDHYTIIYYINDSDGPTRFFSNEGRILDEVDPKKGRAVLFKSNQLHAGTCPVKNDIRLVSNIVFQSYRTLI